MLIKVHVETGAKNEEIKRIADDLFEISIRELAENNMANERIVEILADIFPRQRILLVKGHHNPHKIFQIDAGDIQA